ncbi:MAG: TIR domain-containing protein [Lachnospiraceae bacterium]|nr:TIR domain-containing protein [Lachnospiraceae bacterium]
MKYEAFISYRHREIDEVVAKHIQKIIERYRVPKKIAKTIGKTHVGKVFRDSDELQAASNLSEIIRTGIENSEWLIVICTKRYKDSVWCMEEIEHFIELNGREKVIVILVEGEPNESFPSILTEIEVDGETKHIEPLAVDIRGDSEKAIVKNLKNEQFRFLSSILKVDYDDLKNRQRERRIKRIATAATAAFAILSVITGIIIKKNIDLYNSNQKTLRGESYFLAEYADAAFAEGDRETAIKLALSALPADLDKPDRPFVPRAMRSLTQATGVYDYTAGYHESISRHIEEETWWSFTSFSEDGSTMLLECYMRTDNTLYMPEFEVIRISDGESLYRGREPEMNLDVSGLGRRKPFTGAVLSKDGKKLYYLTEEYFLTCVDVNTGKEYFTADQTYFNEIKVDPLASPDQAAIVAFNSNDYILYAFDLDGNVRFKLDIPPDTYCSLGAIDHRYGRIPVMISEDPDIIKDNPKKGFAVIDLKTGEYSYYETGESTNIPVLSGKDFLTYIALSKDGSQVYIDQFNLTTGKVNRLCDKPGINDDLILTENGEKLYYYIDDTIYEIDCLTGEQLWEYRTPSIISSVSAGNGVLVVGTSDGSVYAFKEEGKTQISTPDGNGNPVYIGGISESAYTSMDASGQNIYVYINRGPEYYKNVVSGSTADIGGAAGNGWKSVPTQGSRFTFQKKIGEKLWLAVYDSETLEKISEISEDDISDIIENFVSYDMISDDYIYVNGYKYGYLLNTSSMETTLKFDSTSEQNYIREDGEVLYNNIMNYDPEVGYIPQGSKFRVIELKTGKVLDEINLPDGTYNAIRIGDLLALGTDEGIKLEGPEGTMELTSEPALLLGFNEKRGLLIYQTTSESPSWCVYDVNKKENVLEAPVTDTPFFSFFGNNRYFLLDSKEVYDMDTWENVLTLKPENGVVLTEQTTDDSPYFIFQTYLDSKITGCLYEKEGDGEMIGMIDNFLAMAPDGEVIVYDGQDTLYKFTLLSPEQILQKGVQMIGGADLSPEQKEKYHIFR